MIKLICPQCSKPVPVPDDFTGAEVTCPSCGKVFPAPARYTPAVLSDPPPPAPAPTPVAAAPEPHAVPAKPSVPEKPPVPTYGLEPAPERPAPPPGFVPPAPPPVPPTATAPPPVPTGAVAAPDIPGGYTKSIGITISPKVVAWLPAILLTITFFCTFFSWVGAYIGGYAVHSQGAWRAMVGSVHTNPVLSQYMPGDGKWAEHAPSDFWLMFPFIALLIVAVLFAWADRGLQTFDPRRLPPLAKFWPWRKTVIGVAGGLAWLFLFVQTMNGFGMERAIQKTVRENPELVKAREEAAGSPSKLAAVENREDSELAKYNLERTFWLSLALWCNFIGAAAVLVGIQLERRGNKPPPKILLHY